MNPMTCNPKADSSSETAQASTYDEDLAIISTIVTRWNRVSYIQLFISRTMSLLQYLDPLVSRHASVGAQG